MDHTVDQRDFLLLEQDKYTFSVLSRVLHGPCNCILSDHERLIICHTDMPYPVWIWTSDHATADEMERAWQLTSQRFPMAEGYRYNLKYDLAAYFLARAKESGIHAGIDTNLFAYDCPAPIVPVTPAEGYVHCCTQADVDEAAELIMSFRDDIGNDQLPLERCRSNAQSHIDHNTFFFWKNAAGETVACCSYHPNDTLGCVGSVYTKPEHRRRHYAQHLVYHVTRLIDDLGLTPMLYTDADYAASNACYEKIGYVLRGKLCTISAE